MNNGSGEINRSNCQFLLDAFMNKNSIESPRVAKAIGCSQATAFRILLGITFPSTEFMKQTGFMLEYGIGPYEKLSQSEKEKLSEALGAISGGVIGFGAIGTAISAFGVVSGLSAAGVTSGLAAIGALVGGGMVAGVTAAAAIPIAAAALGYGVIKGVHAGSGEHSRSVSIDPLWEETKESEGTIYL